MYVAEAPAVPPPVLPECNPGIWTKLIGSWSRRNDSFDFARLFGPQFAGLNFSENYRQTTLGTISERIGREQRIGRQEIWWRCSKRR
jgi:hypothetical protein